MSGEFRKILPDEAVVPNETRTIRPISAAFAPPVETAGDDLSSRRPFVNDRRNSRLAQTLPSGEWTIRASVATEPGLRPKHILHHADRIIIQGDGPWQLFDTECKTLARGYLYGSDVLLDAENNLFYFSDEAGMIEARRLDDGSRAFSASLIFGQAYARTFIARRDDRMIVVSTEREMDQHSPERPEDSLIEILTFDEPPELDADGILLSAEVSAEMRRKTLLLLAAFQNETLTVAAENQICLIDSDLQIKLALDGEFTPLVMSLDDAGIVYLVLSDNGVAKMRAIKPDGERIFSIELFPRILDITTPPIIAYDHRVFLIKDEFLTAFDAGGRCVWEHRANGLIAGAVVTADDQLLIGANSELGVYEADGRFRVLYDFKNETLQTPPTLNANGELIVVTDQKLYCLAQTKNL